MPETISVKSIVQKDRGRLKQNEFKGIQPKHFCHGDNINH